MKPLFEKGSSTGKPLFEEGSGTSTTQYTGGGGGTRAVPRKVAAVSFDEVDLAKREQALEDHRKQDAMLRGVGSAAASPLQSRLQQVTKHTPGEGLFPESRPDPMVADVIAEVRQSFAAVYATEYTRIDRYIKQLLPLTSEKCISWGDKVLKTVGELSSNGSKLTKRFSEANSEELMRDALDDANGSGGVLDRMFRKGGTANVKPRLAGLKAQLSGWLPECENISNQARETRIKATAKMVAFASVCAVVGDQLDASIATVANSRRIILQQSLAQLELTAAQMDQLRATLLDQIARVDQLLYVTIPAIEAART